MRNSLTTSAIAIALSAVAGVNVAAQALPAGEGCASEYAIGAEDVLDIVVWDNTDISRSVPVRPDGKISLPLVNDVQAAGFTPMQLRETLARSLGQYLAAPSVSVIVREVHSFKVTVIGEVKLAGRYELRSRATVLDVLAMAGGLTDYAERGKLLLLRQQGGATRQIPLELDKMTAKSGVRPVGSTDAPAPNICLQPGDIVVVP